MIRIYIPDSWLNSEHDDFNGALAKHAFLAELRRAKKGGTPELIEYYNIDNDKLSLAFAKQLLALGVVIKGMPLFIEIEDKDDVVPEGVFGSTNDDGESHTWSTWKKPNHNFLEIDGRIFIGTNAHTHEDLDFEYLVDVLDDLVHPLEIQALQANIEEI